MKKTLIFSLILSLLLSAAGCSLLNPAPKDFDVADYNMVITADEGFKEDTGGDWSLQITNYKSYISVMPFTYEELGDITPEEIYSLQNEDIFTRREDAKVLEEETKKTENGKQLSAKCFPPCWMGRKATTCAIWWISPKARSALGCFAQPCPNIMILSRKNQIQ
ncbi:MAG: hypothetical protein IKC06_08830 [Clostridia bacterium]|nr:hypothetical protein [Clostridia bacterium]